MPLTANQKLTIMGQPPAGYQWAAVEHMRDNVTTSFTVKVWPAGNKAGAVLCNEPTLEQATRTARLRVSYATTD